MGIEELTQLEIAQGVLSLLYAVIGIVIGSIIAVRYFSYKRVELLGVGTSLALACSPWLAGGISFITFIFFDFILSDPVYLFINYGFTGLAITLYVHAITSLIYPESVKKIVSIYITLTIIFEVILIYLLSTNIDLVGTKDGRFDSAAGNIPILFILFVLISTLIFTTLFIIVCLKSPDKKIQWRGRFIIISTILMVIGSFLDNVSINITMLLIGRFLLIVRLFFSYLGWILPEKVAKWLIKEEDLTTEESAEGVEGVSQFFQWLKAKPKEISEEEVKFYREQTVCLVCRTHLVKYTLSYFCHDCRALYCAKCARAISKLENACWACNATIDDSKPVKVFKTEEIEISEKPQEKLKNKNKNK